MPLPTPKELLMLREDDTVAVTSVEEFLIHSDEFEDYAGGEMTITLPKELSEEHLTKRFNVRCREMENRWRTKGWHSIIRRTIEGVVNITLAQLVDREYHHDQ